MAEIKFGATYSERDNFSDLPDYSKRVEELGYDSLWVTENISSDSPALECFTALSFMAAHTSRLTIGTSVLLLPLRNPVLVAQTVNSLDVLSGGRVVLGVGVGGPGGSGSEDRDFQAYGASVQERGGRCDEALEVMKRLWTETSVTYEGSYYRLRDYTLLPRPIQQPHPPIWVGGHAEGVLRRAGRWADGYIPVGKTPEECARLYERVGAYAREYGRDPSSITRALHISLCLADTPAEAARISEEVLTRRYNSPTSPSADGPFLYGSPERCRQTLQAFIDAGVAHFVFNMNCYPGQALSQLEVVAREVLPQG